MSVVRIVQRIFEKLAIVLKKTADCKKTSQERKYLLFLMYSKARDSNRISRGIPLANSINLEPTKRSIHYHISRDGFKKIIENKLISCLKSNYPYAVTERYFALWFQLAQEKRNEWPPYHANRNFDTLRPPLPNWEPFKNLIHKQPKGILATNLISNTSAHIDEEEMQDLLNKTNEKSNLVLPDKKRHASDTNIANKAMIIATEDTNFKISSSETGLTKRKDVEKDSRTVKAGKALRYEIEEVTKNLIKRLKNDRTSELDRPKPSKNIIHLVSKEEKAHKPINHDNHKDFLGSQEQLITTKIKKSCNVKGDQEIVISITLEQ